MTKALIAFIALLGLFYSSVSYAGTLSCFIYPYQFSQGEIASFVMPASSNNRQLCASKYTGLTPTSYGAHPQNSGLSVFQYADIPAIAVGSNFSSSGNPPMPSTCEVNPSAPECDDEAPTCPDGSTAPNGDAAQCSTDTRTQKLCSATPTGATVCIDVEANSLIDAVTAFCTAIGSSAAATDAANNVGSCSNGTGVFSLGFNSAPIAEAPPNTTACSTSDCVSDAVNGITRETLPDGSTSVTQVTTDGTTTSTITSPSGAEKVTTTTPDGTVSIVISNPDGSSSTSTTQPNGDSTSTNTSTSGTTTNTTVVNGQTSIVITPPSPQAPPTPQPPPAPPTSSGSNSTDLTPVVDRLDYLGALALAASTKTDQQISQTHYANQRLADLVSSGGATLTALSQVKSAVTSSTQALGTKIDGLGTSLDGIGQKIDQTNSKLDGIGDNLQGIRDGLSGTEFSLSEPTDADLKESLGISEPVLRNDLFEEDITLSNFSAGFTGWMPTQQCPTLPPVTLPFVGEFTWNFTLFCDILALFGVLVMAAAYVSVPFIVFGGKK